MAAEMKRTRNDESIDDDSSSEGDANEDISLMDVGNGDEIQMEFEGNLWLDYDLFETIELSWIFHMNSKRLNMSYSIKYLLVSLRLK